MRACTAHLNPAPPLPVAESTPGPVTENGGSVAPETGINTPNGSVPPEVKPEESNATDAPSRAATPSVQGINAPGGSQNVAVGPPVDDADVIEESSRVPLDAAIAASISVVGTENKAKSASGAILLIGGSSALKGLNAFLAER
jgi:actin-related protein 8